jgi:hypothetical protein
MSATAPEEDELIFFLDWDCEGDDGRRFLSIVFRCKIK